MNKKRILKGVVWAILFPVGVVLSVGAIQYMAEYMPYVLAAAFLVIMAGVGYIIGSTE